MKVRSQEIRIREAQAPDVAAIDELIVHLDEFHARARPDLFQRPSEAPRGEEFLRNALVDPEQQILVAVIAGEVVGYAHLLIKQTAASSHRLERRYCEIDTISVHPEAQRLGAGRKLMEAAISWAESRQVSDHQIAVHAFNEAARALYEQLGFVPSVIVLRRTSQASPIQH